METEKKYNLNGKNYNNFDYIMELIDSKTIIDGNNILVFVETLEDLVKNNDVDDFIKLKNNYERYLKNNLRMYNTEEKIELMAYKNFENIAMIADNSEIENRGSVTSLVNIINQKRELNQIKRSDAYKFVKKNYNK